jgi:site-specific recombinase XerD
MTNNKHGGVYVDEFLFYLKYERGFSINTIKTYEIYLNEFSSYLKRQRLNLDEIDHFCMKRKYLLAAHFALCALTINNAP